MHRCHSDDTILPHPFFGRPSKMFVSVYQVIFVLPNNQQWRHPVIWESNWSFTTNCFSVTTNFEHHDLLKKHQHYYGFVLVYVILLQHFNPTGNLSFGFLERSEPFKAMVICSVRSRGAQSLLLAETSLVSQTLNFSASFCSYHEIHTTELKTILICFPYNYLFFRGIKHHFIRQQREDAKMS